MDYIDRLSLQSITRHNISDIAPMPEDYTSDESALEPRWRLIQAGIDARLALAKAEAAAAAAAIATARHDR